MTIWTCHQDHDSWTERADPWIALADILEREWKGRVLVTSERPEKDKDSICAVLKIIGSARNDITTIVGIPHPSIELAETFRTRGASQIWAVHLKYPAESTAPFLDFAEKIPVEGPVCPALHVKKGDPVELSVCGKRNNRLILVMSHFRKWCLADYESCPHWRGLYDEH